MTICILRYLSYVNITVDHGHLGYKLPILIRIFSKICITLKESRIRVTFSYKLKFIIYNKRIGQTVLMKKSWMRFFSNSVGGDLKRESPEWTTLKAIRFRNTLIFFAFKIMI